MVGNSLKFGILKGSYKFYEISTWLLVKVSYLMIVCLAVSETGTSGGKTRVSFQFMTFL